MSQPATELQITVSEAGAFIPRGLFGREEEIVPKLRQVGVLPEPNGKPRGDTRGPQPSSIRHVALIDLSHELKWLQEHRHEYVGQWVAVAGSNLIAHGANADEVYRAARAAGIESPFVEQILLTDDLPFGGW